MMAVGVTIDRTEFRRSAPHMLFNAETLALKSEAVRSQYAVLGKGDRFLLNAAVPYSQPKGITVVMNWMGELKKD